MGRCISARAREKEWRVEGDHLWHPDEGWHEYTEQGTFSTYSRQGDNEHTTDPMQWKANAVTDTVSYKPLDSDKVSRVRITLEDDRTMYVFYSVNFDPATGEMREGEYRDLLLKE